MNPFIQREVDRLDPTVPFRATTRHHYHTWAKTFDSWPELYIRPQSTAELRKILGVARRCRTRVTVVGSGHSPSDLTCTSRWMVNLDDFNRILSVDADKKTVVMQSGIRLRELGRKLAEHGLAMPNLGSIDQQSMAGAIATATHGSSLDHGLLSDAVLALKIMLADGRVVACSADENVHLFRAALVSLGALGIVTEMTFQAVDAFDIEWCQTVMPLSWLLEAWYGNFWAEPEFVRVWWLPYSKRAVVWKAAKTRQPRRRPKRNWYGGLIGYHAYQMMLYVGRWIPRVLPYVEWFVFGMQYGFRDCTFNSAVQNGHEGLLMDCLYSQFVNEWALPLDKGPEAIRRLEAWIHGDQRAANIPVPLAGTYAHSPIEVRVSDTCSPSSSYSGTRPRPRPRPYLDPTSPCSPTLYLNAILYRPYHTDPPGVHTYYAAFEHLMKDLGGRPHWAKNMTTVTHADLRRMYGPDLAAWLRIRDHVDPDRLFVGDWHGRYLLGEARPQDGADEEEDGELVLVGEEPKAGGMEMEMATASSESSESFAVM